jgi:hypothetical protein
MCIRVLIRALIITAGATDGSTLERITEDGAFISPIGISPVLVFAINQLYVQQQIPNIIYVSTQFHLIGENRHAQRSDPPKQSAR